MDATFQHSSSQYAPTPETPETMEPTQNPLVQNQSQLSDNIDRPLSPESHSRSGSEAASDRGAPTPAPPLSHDSLVTVRFSQDESAPTNLNPEPTLPPMKSPIFDNPTVPGYEHVIAPGAYSLPVQESIYLEPMYIEPTYIEPVYQEPRYEEPKFVMDEVAYQGPQVYQEPQYITEPTRYEQSHQENIPSSPSSSLIPNPEDDIITATPDRNLLIDYEISRPRNDSDTEPLTPRVSSPIADTTTDSSQGMRPPSLDSVLVSDGSNSGSRDSTPSLGDIEAEIQVVRVASVHQSGSVRMSGSVIMSGASIVPSKPSNEEKTFKHESIAEVAEFHDVETHNYEISDVLTATAVKGSSINPMPPTIETMKDFTSQHHVPNYIEPDDETSITGESRPLSLKAPSTSQILRTTTESSLGQNDFSDTDNTDNMSIDRSAEHSLDDSKTQVDILPQGVSASATEAETEVMKMENVETSQLESRSTSVISRQSIPMEDANDSMTTTGSIEDIKSLATTAEHPSRNEMSDIDGESIISQENSSHLELEDSHPSMELQYDDKHVSHILDSENEVITLVPEVDTTSLLQLETEDSGNTDLRTPIAPQPASSPFVLERMSLIEALVAPLIVEDMQENDVNDLPPFQNKVISRVAGENLYSDVSEIDDISFVNDHDSYRDTGGLDPISITETPELPLPTPDLADFTSPLRSPIPQVSVEDHDLLEAELEAQRIKDDEIYSDPEDFSEEQQVVAKAIAAASAAAASITGRDLRDLTDDDTKKELQDIITPTATEAHVDPKQLVDEETKTLEDEDIDYEPPNLSPTQIQRVSIPVSPLFSQIGSSVKSSPQSTDDQILLPSTRYSPTLSELEMEQGLYNKGDSLETEPQIAVDNFQRQMSLESEGLEPEEFIPDIAASEPKSRALTPEPKFLPDAETPVETDEFKDAYSRSPSPEMSDDEVLGQIQEPDVVSPESTPKLSPVKRRDNVRPIHGSPSTDGGYSLQDIPLSSDSSDQGSRDSISDRHSSISGSLQTTPVQRRSLRDSLRIDTSSMNRTRNLDVITEADDDADEDDVNWDQLQKKEDATPRTPGQDKMTALLLARLEQENEKFSMPKPPPSASRNVPPSTMKLVESKRKSRPPSMAQLREMVRSPPKETLRYSQIAVPQMTDLEFYAALVQDYPKAAARFPNLLLVKIRKGIPPVLRGVVWQSMAGSRDLELESKFEELVDQTSPFERIINKDIGRSFPGVDMFRDPEGEGQMMLGRVLKCLSIYIPKLGYCQGLAFVVGPLLMHMPDKQAFCVLVRLMERYDLQASYEPDLAGLHARIFQFRALLEETVPDVAKHLDRLGVESSYVSQWFLSVFATTCPVPFLFRIYDILFAEGAHETLMRVALSLIQKSRDRLLKCNGIEDAMRLLLSRVMWDAYHYNADEFVDSFTSLSDAVTREKLQALEKAYREQQTKDKQRGRDRERDEGGPRSKSAMAMVSLDTTKPTASVASVSSVATGMPEKTAVTTSSVAVSEVLNRNRSGSDASIGMINPKVAAVSAAATRFLGRIWTTNTASTSANPTTQATNMPPAVTTKAEAIDATGARTNDASAQNPAPQGPTSRPGASSLTSPPKSNPTPTSQSQGSSTSGSVLGSGLGAVFGRKTDDGSTPTSSALVTPAPTANAGSTSLASTGSSDVRSLGGSASVIAVTLSTGAFSKLTTSTTTSPTIPVTPASAPTVTASVTASLSTSITAPFRSAASAISSAVSSSASSTTNKPAARSGDVKSLTVTVPASQTQAAVTSRSSSSTVTANAASANVATTNTLSPGLAPSPRTLSMLRRSTSKQSLASTLNSMEAASNSSILSSTSTTSTSTEATTVSLSSRDSGSAESSTTVLPINKPLPPPAPSPTTSAFNTKQVLAPSSKTNNDDRYLHNQIEDLLAALTQLQLNHAILSSDLERERDEREDDKRAVQSLLTSLRHKADSAGNDGASNAPSPEELSQLLDTVEQRFGLAEVTEDTDEPAVKKSTGMTKADLEDELRTTRDQVAAAKSQSQSLERKIHDLEQDVSTLREQLKESQGRVRTMHQDKQRIEKRMQTMRMSRQPTSPIGVGGAAESIRSVFNAATGATPVDEKPPGGGLREFKLGRSPTSPSQPSFSRRASSMRPRDSVMTLSAATAQGEKPTSEQDALLLELVQAKTGEAMAKAEVEELKQKLEALKKQYGSSEAGAPNRSNTAQTAPAPAASGGGFWGGWRR